MKTILVPIDFSPCSTNAAHYAADLALAIKADLLLIHVIQVPVTTAELTMTEYVYREIVEDANIALQKTQADLIKRTQRRIRIDTMVDAGNVSTKVKDLCRQVKPYAIVLGAAGPSLEKFLAGSPVTSLLQNLDYPVLLVPETASFQQFRRILLACELEDIGSDMVNSLPLLKELREQFKSRIDIVTVETSRVLREEGSLFEPGCWKDQLKELYPKVHYIRKPRVEDGILDYLAHNDADLIMVFPKKHGFLDFHVSQSRKLAQHSPIPVLSLHASV
jgi:nucleotide-binding universal stress UspA family protein